MLVLVRHGESELNASNCLVGHLDPQLTELGESQARAAGATLGDVGVLYSSPLTRTRQTAELLGTANEVIVEKRVIELDYGVLDGTPLDSIEPSFWSRWLNDPDSAPSGGETLNQLSQRLNPFLEELFVEKGVGARSDEYDVVVVSHVSPIKAAVIWALGADPLMTWKMRLSTGSITRIAMGLNGPQLVGFNEVPRSR